MLLYGIGDKAMFFHKGSGSHKGFATGFTKESLLSQSQNTGKTSHRKKFDIRCFRSVLDDAAFFCASTFRTAGREIAKSSVKNLINNGVLFPFCNFFGKNNIFIFQSKHF